MLWDNLFDKPIFTLTSDQDWAPPWASSILLEKAGKRGIPLHVFRTNPCKALDRAADNGNISQGWHPNFLPGSSHGADAEAVIDYCRKHFPGATTVRSHTFAESTAAWKALAEAGIVADSQVATLYQPDLVPLLHWTGILRFPVYFEDDIFFEYAAPALDTTPVARTLFSPGLKIFNFHPTFLACNIPSRQRYEEVRKNIFGSETAAPDVIWNERGTANVFDELVDMVQNQGHSFVPFPQVTAMVKQFIGEHQERFPFPFA